MSGGQPTEDVSFGIRGTPTGRGCGFRLKEYSGWRDSLSTANFAEKPPVSALFRQFLRALLRQQSDDRVNCASRAALAGGVVTDDREGKLFSVRGCDVARQGMGVG